jgi:hypothetical protein
VFIVKNLEITIFNLSFLYSFTTSKIKPEMLRNIAEIKTVKMCFPKKL